MNTREEWLSKAVAELRPVFDSVGHPLPEKIETSCGFPSSNARSRKNRAVGEWWSPKQSPTGKHQIFIAPQISESFDVFGVLVHELAHSATEGDGHMGRFPSLVKSLWLEGKPSSTVIGSNFRTNFADLVASLGDYPHDGLTVPPKPKTQSTRMLKASCGCGYTIRLTKTWADQGLPTCVCGGDFVLSK
jgi:hypothetical protein